MRLVLIRHGDAEDYAGSDFQRNLTEKGRKQAGKIGKFLSKIDDLDKAVLVFSPYLRAAQTAEGIQKSSTHYYTSIEDKRLGCGMTPQDALGVVKELSTEDTIIMVGHQPDMGDLAAFLLGSHGAAVEVKKASVLIFEMYGFRSGGGCLEAVVPVKLMG